MTTFESLYARVSHVVKQYRSDFPHDRTEIERYPGVPFIHLALEYGTHIVMLHPADSPFWPPRGVEVPYLLGAATRERILLGELNGMRYLANCYREAGTWTFFDGSSLAQTDASRALATIESYADTARAAWTRQAARA